MFHKKRLSAAVAVAATGDSVKAIWGKRALGAAMAATVSANALSAINVTNQTLGTDILIANESVTPTTTGVQQVGDTAGAGPLDVTGEIGVGIPNNLQIFVRYDWTGAELLANFPDSAVLVDATPSTSLTDGQDGDTRAVFGVLAPPAGFSQTAAVTLVVSGGLGLTASTADVRMRVYSDQGDALSGAANPLSDQSATGAVSLGDALSITFNSATATAEVEDNFLKFDDTPNTTGVLGSFTASAGSTFSLASDLAAANFANLVDSGTTSTVTFEGNFGFATGPNAYYVSNTSTGCAVGTVLTPDTTSFDSATTDMVNANGFPLCVTVDGTTETIPETSFTADVVLTHVVTSSSPSVTQDSGTVGVIDRNGTTVEVAYVTTFSDYNQRLLLNSRHSTDAAYNVTFNTEDGVTATPTAEASGTLPAGENLVLRVSDLVTITGGTRASATVTVVAPNGNIDVATTQVNLSDGGTDTVYWSVK